MKLISLAFVLFLQSVSFSQSLEIRGKIINIAGEKLNGVHITAFPSQRLSITNKDGLFFILADSDDTYLKLSHIGYENKIIMLDSLRKLAGNDKQINIILDEKYVPLKEVVISADKAEEIIIKAIQNIDKNYYQVPQFLKGFYREAAVEDDSLFYFVESYAHVLKEPYTEKKHKNRGYNYSDTVSIVESMFIEIEKKSKINFKMIHGVFNALQNDFVARRAFIFNEKELKDIDLEFKNLTWFNNREVYKIGFEDSKASSDRWGGNVFIDTESYAIVYVEINLLSPLIDRGLGWRSETIKVNTQISYRPHNDKWVLSYIVGEQLEKRRVKGVYVNLSSYIELTISEIIVDNSEKFQIQNLYKIESRTNLEKYSKEYNDNYWKAKNYKLISSDMLRKLQNKIKNSEDIPKN